MAKQMDLSFGHQREIFLSIKPKFADLIFNGEKNHEFRKYHPKESVSKIWLYVTRPVSALKYILEVGPVVEYPGKIPENGFGNRDFNDGKKVSTFAFPIVHLDELVESIPLRRLKNEFNFNPPQGFVYCDTFPDLLEYVHHIGVKRIY